MAESLVKLMAKTSEPAAKPFTLTRLTDGSIWIVFKAVIYPKSPVRRNDNKVIKGRTKQLFKMSLDRLSVLFLASFYKSH